jgi:transposase
LEPKRLCKERRLAVKKSTKKTMSSKVMSSKTMKNGVAAVGIDLSDRNGHYYAIDQEGLLIEKGSVMLLSPELQRWASGIGKTVIAIEAGTHSPWISRLLSACGHEVIVANPVKVALITKNVQKTDSVDAEYLARLARFDRGLLFPIHHRGEQAQIDLQLIRTREIAVQLRTKAISHVRGTVKSFGARLPKCSTEAFVNATRDSIPAALGRALRPMLSQIDQLTKMIAGYDRQVEKLVEERYPEVERVRQIRGVGALTGLAFVLVLEDASRFRSSRSVGAFLGLTSKKDQSGDSDPQRGITKAGDRLLRRLLIQSAHYILGRFGEDCDLRRHGEKIAERGGKRAKKRATTAVARKLSVLMHRLWVNDEVYEPLRNYHAAMGIQLAA